ncbi:TPA: hypothetical protein HA270_00005, partial [Candidatus Woesearchaeota archaeon]|nr:hypothetical protein [Candidatus Woesearchaeota archaeon]
PNKLIRKKGISHASHRFHTQFVTSSFVLQSIAHFEIPREKRKVKKDKKKNSEERKVKTKTARAAQAAGQCCWHRHEIERCAIGCEGWAAMQCTTECS